MNAMLQTALAAAALVASFAAAATEQDKRQHEGRFDDDRYQHQPQQPYQSHQRQPQANWRHDVDARQARQEWRIRQAWQRGELTRREFRVLRHEQHEIARYEAWAQSDGRIGHREQRQLHDMLDRADMHIRHLARNEVGALTY